LHRARLSGEAAFLSAPLDGEAAFLRAPDCELTVSMSVEMRLATGSTTEYRDMGVIVR